MNQWLHIADGAMRWLWRTSWQSAVLVELILIAQWIFRSRLSARGRYALWGLLLLRLMMPALPKSHQSIFNLFQAKEKPPASVSLSAGGTFRIAVGEVEGHLMDAVAPVADPVVAQRRPIPWMAIGFSLWAAGVALDVLPTVSADRKFVTVRTKARVSDLKELLSEPDPTAPAEQKLKVQKPVMDIREIETLASIPVGTSLVLTGFQVTDGDGKKTGVSKELLLIIEPAIVTATEKQ
jgi:hypothetical protein